MEKPESMDIDVQKISEMKVADLRVELEKRGLDKTGTKPSLIERLTKHATREENEELSAGDSAEQKESGDLETNDVEMKENGKNAAAEEGDEAGLPEEEVCEELDPEEEAELLAEAENAAEDDLEEEMGLEENLESGSPEGFPVDTIDIDQVDDEEDLEAKAEEEKEELVEQTEGAKDSADEPSTAAEQVKDEAPSADAPMEQTAQNAGQAVEEAASDAPEADEAPLEVYVTEADTNFDYDLDKGTAEESADKPGEHTSPRKGKDGAKEQDTPTPTKDEAKPGQVGQSKSQKSSGGDKKSSSSTNDSSKAKARPSKGTSAASSSASKSVDNKRKTSSTSSSDKKDEIIRTLWISGLSSLTKASDLKTLCSKYGKVSGAKIVTNVHKPGARCFGVVTMSSSDEMSKCVQHLNKTELHGRTLTVEKAKNNPIASIAAKSATKKAPAQKSSDKDKDRKSKDTKEGDKDKDKGKREPRKLSASQERARKEDRIRRDQRRLEAWDRRMMEEKRNFRLMQKRENIRLDGLRRRLKDDEERILRTMDKLKLEKERAKEEQFALLREKQQVERELKDMRDQQTVLREELRRLEQQKMEEQRKAVKRSYESRAVHEVGGWPESKRVMTEDRYMASSRAADSRGDMVRHQETRRPDRYNSRAEVVAMADNRGNDKFSREKMPVRRDEYADKSRQVRGEWKDDTKMRYTASRADMPGDMKTRYKADTRKGDSWSTRGESDRARESGGQRPSWSDRGKGWTTSQEVQSQSHDHWHSSGPTSAGPASGSLLGNPTPLYSGAAVQAAGMMMGSSGGVRAQDHRYGSSGGGAGYTRRY